MLSINTSQVLSFLRNLGALAAIVVGGAGTGNPPNAVRAILVAGGLLHQIVDHSIKTQPPTPKAGA